MEEKERYEILYFDNDTDTSWKIIDNKTKQEVGGINDMIKQLNRQDKQIRDLEQENLSLQEQSIRDNQNWIEETTQLKQQLVVTEKALELACKEITGSCEYCSYKTRIECPVEADCLDEKINYFKTKAKEMLESE